MLMVIFGSVDESLSGFTESITKTDNSAAVEMLMVLDLRIHQVQHDLPVFAKVLISLRRRLLVVAEAFVVDQVAVIDAMKFSAKRRSGVFPFVSLFPTFITKMEMAMAKAPPGGTARDFMNRGYERIISAIFRSLDALAAQAERGADDKERINASVMNIRTTPRLVQADFQ